MGLSSAVGAARWYQGKGSADPAVRAIGTLRPPGAGDHALAVLAVGGGDGASSIYVAPVHARTGALADDPADCPELWRALARACTAGGALDGDGCRLLARGGPAAPPAALDLGAASVRGIGADQTNTTVVLGDRVVLKCYRRLGDGAARELSRVRDLTAAGYGGVPAMHGAAELELGGTRHAVLLMQAYVPGTWDGFAQADRDLSALRGPEGAEAAAARWAPATGRMVAGLHHALGPGRPATAADLDGWREHGRRLVAATAARAGPEDRALLHAAGDALAAAWDAAGRGALPPVGPAHGDLHLAQLLFAPTGPVAVIDFEPAPSVLPDPPGTAESPARDLAALLRSVDNAGLWTAEERGTLAPGVVAAWIAAARAQLDGAYRSELGRLGAPAPPGDAAVRAFELVQAIHECLYAAAIAPFWSGVARRALADLLR